MTIQNYRCSKVYRVVSETSVNSPIALLKEWYLGHADDLTNNYALRLPKHVQNPYSVRGNIFTFTDESSFDEVDCE